LESRGYEIANGRGYNKVKRMNKGLLTELYNFIRYQSNNEYIENDLLMVYGITITEL